MKETKEKKQVELLRKPSGTITISGDLTANERKFYNKLLNNASMQLKDDLNQIVFTISLEELKDALDVSENDKHNKYYKKILRKLYDTTVTYNLLDKDKVINGMAHLMDNLDIRVDNNTKRVTISYTIPLIIRKSLVGIIQGDPESLYARVNLAVIKGLKSKYSIILYELCKDYENVKIPEIPIETFKRIFGIEHQKIYQLFFPKIRERVLDPAVKELNENPNVEFYVTYELIKKANKYTHIKFTVQPKKKALKEIDNPELQKLISMLPEDLQKSKRVAKVFREYLAQYGYEYIKAQIEYTNQKNPECYIAYIDSAIKENYAKVEVKNTKTEEEIKTMVSKIVEKMEMNVKINENLRKYKHILEEKGILKERK